MITVKTCKNCHGKAIINTTRNAVVIECSNCGLISAKSHVAKITPIRIKKNG